MAIIINDNIGLFEIQKKFNSHFPFLKLEFFQFEPGEKRIFSKKNIIADTKLTLGQVKNVHGKGTISINGNQKVSTLEKNFQKKYGLAVQVFWKAGKNWLETNTSDNRTLSMQNMTGKETTQTKGNVALPDYDAYHEQP